MLQNETHGMGGMKTRLLHHIIICRAVVKRNKEVWQRKNVTVGGGAKLYNDQLDAHFLYGPGYGVGDARVGYDDVYLLQVAYLAEAPFAKLR